MERKELIQEFLGAAVELSSQKPTGPINRNLQGEILALHVLSQHSSGLAPGLLGKKLGVSAPRIAAILDRMEEKGLVLRIQDPEDRRRMLIRLTDQGLEQEKINADGFFAHAEHMLSALDEEEIRAFIAILRKLKTPQCDRKEDKPC